MKVRKAIHPFGCFEPTFMQKGKLKVAAATLVTNFQDYNDDTSNGIDKITV